MRGKTSSTEKLAIACWPLGIAAPNASPLFHMRLDIISIEGLGGMGKGYASRPVMALKVIERC